MRKTINYKLNKPEGTDLYNVDDFNANFEVIDEVLKNVSEKAEESVKHAENKENPHEVTAEDVGLGNVPNVKTNDQTPTYTPASANAELSSGEKLSVAFGKIAKAIKSLIAHLADNVSHITSAERTSWNDANSKKHSHSNKATLDSITAAYTSEEKTKLSGIAAGANAYTHPSSGVTAGTYRNVTVNAQGHVTGGSNPTVSVPQGGTGATTAAAALKNLGLSATAAELNYMNGVKSNVQAQLNNKAASSHSHSGMVTATLSGTTLNLTIN